MNRTLGQIAFEAYNEAKGGTTWDGKPIPPWGEVGAEVQAAWEAAETAVLAHARTALSALPAMPSAALAKWLDPNDGEHWVQMTSILTVLFDLGASGKR